jgi:deoxyribose-phosphate aldolase
MRARCKERVQIKAAHGVRTLDAAIEVYNAGCTRFGATATAQILDDWKARLSEQEKAEQEKAVQDAQ